MSGHNKFSKIKHKKAASDAKKSNAFSKLSKLITNESKKCGGDVNSPGLATAIIAAKKENMPKDTIDRAVKKGLGSDVADLESITYEAYGPGGSAMIIETLSDNRNRIAGEVRHIFTKNNLELGTPGSVAWAFEKKDGEWIPSNPIELSESDLEKLSNLVSLLEENEDVQKVYTSVSNLDLE